MEAAEKGSKEIQANPSADSQVNKVSQHQKTQCHRCLGMVALSRHLHLLGPLWPLGPVTMSLLTRLSWKELRGFCLACTCYVSNSSALVAPSGLESTAAECPGAGGSRN